MANAGNCSECITFYKETSARGKRTRAQTRQKRSVESVEQDRRGS
jgi:hypothetical protein